MVEHARGGPKAASALADTELQRLSHACVQAFRGMIGPDRDIRAPDVNTDAGKKAALGHQSTVIAWR